MIIGKFPDRKIIVLTTLQAFDDIVVKLFIFEGPK